MEPMKISARDLPKGTVETISPSLELILRVE